MSLTDLSTCVKVINYLAVLSADRGKAIALNFVFLIGYTFRDRIANR